MHRRLPPVALTVLLIGAVLMLTPLASAQSDEAVRPIPRWALDLRAAYARYKPLPELEALGTVTASRGLGVDVGLHVYPLRTKAVTIGIGGELLASRGGRSPDIDEFPGPRATTSFRSLAPQISFNFGNREGWSYISAGIGKSGYFVDAGGVSLANGDAVRLKTINYGAGARWFWNDHLALCVDVRIYAVNSNPRVGTLLGTPRANLIVISTGFSFH